MSWQLNASGEKVTRSLAKVAGPVAILVLAHGIPFIGVWQQFRKGCTLAEPG